MRKISVIDCETDPFKYGRVPEPFIWGYFDGTLYRQFDAAADLVEFLWTREEICYAHNGGKFDFHLGLLEFAMEDEELFIINGRIVQFKIGECEFRDSFSILPVGLAQFEKQEFDYSLLEKEVRNIPQNRQLIEEYLRSDCVNLHEMVSEFVKTYGCNITLASTAMKQWQKIAKKKPPRSDEYFYNQFKPYYYGGRVQCFRKGLINEDFSVVDINSAYPRAMLDMHPFGLEAFALSSFDNIRGDCFYSIRALSNGALPYRDIRHGKLIFPSDTAVREYHVTGWELLAGLETGTVDVLDFIGGWRFTDLIDFGDYVDHFYQLKQAAELSGDKAMRLFAKLFLNSLYGKWATNPEHFKRYTITKNEQVVVGAMLADDDRFKPAGKLGSWHLLARSLDDEEKRFYNIATAASITGWVRAYLWRSICKCDGVLYCDTDSIAAVGVGGLDIGGGLGQWKHEGNFEYAAIAGRKLYAFKEKESTKWKTASKGARLTAEEICEVAAGGSAYYRFDAPSFSIDRPPSFVERNILMTD